MENIKHTYPGRQHDSLELFAENGRDKESRTDADLKGNLGVSTRALDHDYCRTFTRESQLHSRLGISATERFFRMETVPSNFQQNMASIGEETRNRTVCFKVIKSASKLLLLETGTQQSWHQQKWYHKSLYALPPFALIHKVLKKVEEDKVSSLIIVTPIWQTQSWYPELLRLSVRNSIILSLKEYLLKGPQNQKHPLIQNRTMQLAVWVVSANVWQRKEYQKGVRPYCLIKKRRYSLSLFIGLEQVG